MAYFARRCFLLAFIIAALGCSLFAGYEWSARRNAPAPAGPASPGAEREAGLGVILKVYYRGCGHTVRGPDNPVGGRSLSDVLKDHPGAAFSLLPGGVAEVTIEADGLCPDDAPYRFLTIKDGYVAVYYGRSASPDNLKEVRADLPAVRLSAGDLRRLEKGEVVMGDEAVYSLLEGLLD